MRARRGLCRARRTSFLEAKALHVVNLQGAVGTRSTLDLPAECADSLLHIANGSGGSPTCFLSQAIPIDSLSFPVVAGIDRDLVIIVANINGGFHPKVVGATLVIVLDCGTGRQILGCDLVGIGRYHQPNIRAILIVCLSQAVGNLDGLGRAVSGNQSGIDSGLSPVLVVVVDAPGTIPEGGVVAIFEVVHHQSLVGAISRGVGGVGSRRLVALGATACRSISALRVRTGQFGKDIGIDPSAAFSVIPGATVKIRGRFRLVGNRPVGT